MHLTVKDLSPDQLDAYNSIMKWVTGDARSDEQPLLTLGGFAGTGKSTLVSMVAERIELPAFCAYTGKAASVLRRKLTAAGIATVGPQPRKDGLPSSNMKPFCGTIHSLIYRPCDCQTRRSVALLKPCPEKGCAEETSWTSGISVCEAGHRGKVATRAAFDGLEPATKTESVKLDDNGRCHLCHGKEWFRREILDREYGLIIVDEASMVDDVMLRDLRSFNVPILAVGDHGQLPPVGGNGSLMKAPELRLEKIHRQAEGNPIIALSKIIRETGRLPEAFEGAGNVTFGRLRFLEAALEERYADADAARLRAMSIACYTNKRRVGLNVAVRRARGIARTGREMARAGEHVVCLRNIKAERGLPPVANGMRGVLGVDLKPKETIAQATKEVRRSQTTLIGDISFPDDGVQEASYEVLWHQFNREKTYASVEELAQETGLHSFAAAGRLFDFGYAMTVHKMQGSSVEDLVVCVERPGPVGDEDWRRWLYTAITRASDRLTILR